AGGHPPRCPCVALCAPSSLRRLLRHREDHCCITPFLHLMHDSLGFGLILERSETDTMQGLRELGSHSNPHLRIRRAQRLVHLHLIVLLEVLPCLHNRRLSYEHLGHHCGTTLLVCDPFWHVFGGHGGQRVILKLDLHTR